MGNYLIMITVTLTVVPILVGVLLGLLRGSRRSILRLALVVLCVVLAFALCGALSKAVMNAEVTQFADDSEESMTVAQFVQSQLGEDYAEMAEYVLPLIEIFVKIVLFLLLFGLFQFLTWIIVYPLCKLFVRPRRVTDSEGRTRIRRHRLLGAAFGLIQGVVVALCLCIIVNGLIVQANNFVALMDGVSEISNEMSGESSGSESEEYAAIPAEDETNTSDGEEALDMNEMKVLIEEYNNSVLGKLYNSIGSKPFGLIAQVNVDGEKYTLSGQMEALNGIVDIAKEFVKISDLDFENFYMQDTSSDKPSAISQLSDVLKNVEQIKQGFSDEASRTVRGMMDALGKTLGVDIGRFYDINFAEEAEAFNKLSQYKDKDFSEMTPEQIREEAKELIKDLAKSELLLDMLSEQEIDLANGLDKEQIEEIDSSVDELLASGEIDQATADRLRDIFNLSGNGGDNDNTTLGA